MAFYSKNASRIKMVALMPHGIDNIIWYSPEDQNKKQPEKVVEGMLNRYKSSKLYRLTRVIQFYDQETNIKIDEFRP